MREMFLLLSLVGSQTIVTGDIAANDNVRLKGLKPLGVTAQPARLQPVSIEDQDRLRPF
ncbi:hypothetical protein [Roseibium sp.]|uniref:hypothetical protein n=1 Tax=Roseibium sp. TaxID=1936156 RepID=UPI003BAB904B